MRAFRNGRTRFTFTMTVDARLQKGFTVGDRKLTAIVDAYNVFNQFLQIEEIAVTGPHVAPDVGHPAADRRPGRHTHTVLTGFWVQGSGCWVRPGSGFEVLVRGWFRGSWFGVLGSGF